MVAGYKEMLQPFWIYPLMCITLSHSRWPEVLRLGNTSGICAAPVWHRKNRLIRLKKKKKNLESQHDKEITQHRGLPQTPSAFVQPPRTLVTAVTQR